MCGRFDHWFAKTLALLILISVVANPCPPGSIERDASAGQTLTGLRTMLTETARQPTKHGDHARSLSHCHGDAMNIASPIKIMSCKEKAAFSVEVALLGPGYTPKVTLRPPIA